jgi:hypothetical protein
VQAVLHIPDHSEMEFLKSPATTYFGNNTTLIIQAAKNVILLTACFPRMAGEKPFVPHTSMEVYLLLLVHSALPGNF